MKKQADFVYFKTRVVIDFTDGAEAEAFFRMFAENSGNDAKNLEMIARHLPANVAQKKIDSLKELKHNYYIKMA